ncbi:MAG: hypothetical protein IJ664_04210 [Clostridia bacterium]|nr:hypothetical protein [Clostridia bacterium]
MKKLLFFFLSVFAASLLWSASALAEETAEWTVMFYLCGSDLESRHGLASGNLEEILECYPYSTLGSVFAEYPENASIEERLAGMRVNVVVETGGSKAWHAAELGMEVDPSALQRWRYKPMETINPEETNTFALEETLPLQSMADPKTLSDFIRWAAEKHPARKYALVLWDHGGGSKTGIFIDELFEGDVMYLDELHDAFQGGGVNFEAVLFDACMMANLETAYAIKDNAKWMIASEEVVAGKGTAMGRWLQQLYYAPQWDGARLGYWICNMTHTKYANEADAQSQSLLTWSVINLTEIDHLASVFDRFFACCCDAYVNDTYRMRVLTGLMSGAEEFGVGSDNMIDLSDLLYEEWLSQHIGMDLYWEMMDALVDVVDYAVQGAGRSKALGISFCYAAELSPAELNVYARNCPSPHYLALLDAITPAWAAPEWVYEQVQRLPDIRELKGYQVTVEKKIAPDGTPGVFTLDGGFNVLGYYMNLYRVEEKTGSTLRYGTTAGALVDDPETGDFMFCPKEPCLWLSMEGVYCDAELVSYDIFDNYLFNIPIQVGTEQSILRCGYESEIDDYVVYGVWEGYDADTGVFGRNVQSLAQLAGQEFRLLYPIDGADHNGKTAYETSMPMTLYRSLRVTEEPLPPGPIYIEFWARDMFLRPLIIGKVEMYWDGQTLTLAPGETWEGTTLLTAPEK